jgi:hypothetical protein
MDRHGYDRVPADLAPAGDEKLELIVPVKVLGNGGMGWLFDHEHCG